MKSILATQAVTRGVGGQMVRILSLTVWIAVLPAVVGCASNPPSVERHPLVDPSGSQAVAVIASSEAPNINLVAFARGYSEGAAKAGAAGVGLGTLGALTALQLAPLALLAGPAGILAMPAIIVGGAVIGFVAGAAVVVQATVPEEQALAIEQMATSAVSQLQLPNLTAAAVATGVTSFAARDASVMDREGVSEPVDYRALRERGYAAVIELRVTEIGFSGSGADTIMALFMTAEARFVNTASGQPVAMRGLVYVSPQHRIGVWAGDNAAVTKAEIERGCRTVAERIVDDLVLRVDGGAEPVNPLAEIFFGPDAPAATVCGMAPRSPRLEWAGGFAAPRHLATSTADSVSPTLAWEGRPSLGQSAANASWSRVKAEDMVYDLRIWNALDDAPGALVYERYGLSRTQHQLEVPLDSGSTYFWSVRTRYQLDGGWRATRWSAANAPMFFLSKPLKDALFYSRVERGTLTRVGCGNNDLTPCGCLDFIPTPNLFRFSVP